MSQLLSPKHSVTFDEGFRPTITTERLVIRCFHYEDMKDLFALLSDDHITRWFGCKKLKSLAETETFLDRAWRFIYAVTEKGGDKVIGLLQAVPLPNAGAHVGYCISSDYEGRGYMTEALTAFEDYIFSKWSWLKTLKTGVFVGNEASRRVLEKCGFHFSGFNKDVYNPYGLVDDEDLFETTVGDFEWKMKTAA